MASVHKDTALAEAQALETTSHDAEKKDHIAAHEAEYVEDAEKHEPVSAWVEDTPEEKKLLRKIDLWLMPAIWVLYLFSYMVESAIRSAEDQTLTVCAGQEQHRQCAHRWYGR